MAQSVCKHYVWQVRQPHPEPGAPAELPSTSGSATLTMGSFACFTSRMVMLACSGGTQRRHQVTVPAQDLQMQTPPSLPPRPGLPSSSRRRWPPEQRQQRQQAVHHCSIPQGAHQPRSSQQP